MKNFQHSLHPAIDSVANIIYGQTSYGMMETILAIDTAKNALKYLKDLNPFFLGVCVCVLLKVKQNMKNFKEKKNYRHMKRAVQKQPEDTSISCYYCN